MRQNLKGSQVYFPFATFSVYIYLSNKTCFTTFINFRLSFSYVGTAHCWHMYCHNGKIQLYINLQSLINFFFNSKYFKKNFSSSSYPAENTASPREAVHLCGLQIQLSAVRSVFNCSQQEKDKVTPMTEENKLSRVFFITTTFKGQSLKEPILTSPQNVCD